MRLVRHYTFWDGPLSGICLYEGRKHYFKINEDSPEDDYDAERSFDIVYLTDEQIAVDEAYYSLFAQHVGTHCEYDENNKRDSGKVRPQSEHGKFYNAGVKAPDRSGPVVKVVSEKELKAT